MERRALVVALTLTLPLALYGIPYAYATTTSSSYVAIASDTIGASTGIPVAKTTVANCLNTVNDYATGGGWALGNEPPGTPISAPTLNGALPDSSPSTHAGFTPNGWSVTFENTNSISYGYQVYAICQTPITVAGIGVPEFGSLYVAIALGAVLYFLLSRRFAGRPTISRQA